MSLLLLFGGAGAAAPPASGGGVGWPLGLRTLTLGPGYTRADLYGLGLTEEEIKQLLALGWLLLGD